MAKDFFEKEEELINWSVIEEYEKEDTPASWAMALAELRKVLNFLLEEEGYFGDLDKKIRQAKVRFTDLKGLKKALQVYRKVFEDYEEKVSVLEIQEAVKALKQAVKDLVAKTDFSPPTLLERLEAWLEYHFLSERERFIRGAFWFLFGVVLIFVLDSTHFGQSLIHQLAKFLASILSYLLVVGLIGGVVLALAVLTIIFFGRGK
ncbi:hypothetical protein J7L13_02400 [bacterium]|nr:hypothetical protein [bacterium]